MSRSNSSSGTTMAIVTLLISAMVMLNNGNRVTASQRTIHLDTNGQYKGVVIGFSEDFEAETTSRPTIIKSIMDQMQNTSNILRQLIGVQFGEVTLVVPENWELDQHLLGLFSDQSRYSSLQEADIIFTDDDKEQILTMQFGECGEGSLPINFPKKYISDSYTPRLLAHQWLLYRYGVFNEFGYTNDYQYPVYFLSPDGGIRNHSQINPIITSCSNKPDFSYSSQCNRDIAVDPKTGRPVNPNCDVVPVEGHIQSSFMYAPLAVTEYRLCNGSTHDYLSPNKQNVLCDYQSTFDVIRKHLDFDLYKPKSMASVGGGAPIQFNLWRTRGSFNKAHVMYALPVQNAKSLIVPMRTIEKLSIFNYYNHRVMFQLYNGHGFEGSHDWSHSADIPMVFPESKPISSLNLANLTTEIIGQFGKQTESASGGTCVLFYSGSVSIENSNDEWLSEKIADQLNKANIALKIIVFERIPTNNVLNLFDQLMAKLTTKSSVEYAFGEHQQYSRAVAAFKNQLVPIMNSIILDLLADVTEQQHILIKQETVQSDDKAGIGFNIDSTIAGSDIIVELHTDGTGSTLALYPQLAKENGQLFKFSSLKMVSEKTVLILFRTVPLGAYKFTYHTNDLDKFITISVRALLATSQHRSYRDSPLTARCWINTQPHSPYRGYVQVVKGLNGLVYDADVSLIVRPFTQSQQKSEITFSLYDNGKANPDISANDGIYSSYLDHIFSDSESGNVAYSISARIVSHRMAVKGGNFGNTVMFKNKPRCCGQAITSKGDEVSNAYFERKINCGSFFYSMEKASMMARNSYAIRDLTLENLDPFKRILTLKWSSPFADQTRQPVIKILHSNIEHSELLMDIKKNFEQSNDNDFEFIVDETVLQESNRIVHGLYEVNPELEGGSTQFEMKPTDVAYSQRETKIRITNPEEGFYYVVVKERAAELETKLSNVISVYLKSNVPIENTTALAIDDSKAPVDYGQAMRRGSLSWIHILIICIISALVLFVIILIIICVTIRRHRRSNKDYKGTLDGVRKPQSIDGEKAEVKSSYFDASSLMSHSMVDPKNSPPQPPPPPPPPISNTSNNTSCSSVNTVDNGCTYLCQPAAVEPEPRMNNHNNNNNNSTHMKELNVATLLPNSWDAKELLDHWGRVQEAKQRQESPPSMRIPSTSPSLPSYGRASSLDNFNGQVNAGYLVQPIPPAQHYYGEMNHEPYHQSAIYSSYSNASSIWQHQQAQAAAAAAAAAAAQQQYQHRIPSDHSSYDEPGLPEYSVVRKHPNISQV